jgi:hypothetical protein
VKIVGRRGRPREAGVVVRPVLGLEKRIRRLEVRNAVAAQLFDQAILLGAVIALDPPLACGELAGMIRMPKVAHMPPNCVKGSAPGDALVCIRHAHIHVLPVGVERLRNPEAIDPGPQDAHRRPDHLMTGRWLDQAHGDVLHHHDESARLEAYGVMHIGSCAS